MTKKTQQSSGSSYSLLALLKRTLFMREASSIGELAEEVHEYMLKDQPQDQIRQRYVEPILRHNPSFREELFDGKPLWKLTEGNKVNDAVHEVFQTYKMALSERQILNRLAKVKQVEKIAVVLDLKNDARFSDLDLESGKYWILSEWTVINEYARSLLLRAKAGLEEHELVETIVKEYGLNPEAAVFIPMLDERFVKKEKKWTLRKFVEQKTKIRASRMERIYQYLQKAARALTADELTSGALNMPASTTDVDEKLTADYRFVLVNEKWDIRARYDQERKAAVEPAIDLAVEIPAADITPEPDIEETAMPTPTEPLDQRTALRDDAAMTAEEFALPVEQPAVSEDTFAATVAALEPVLPEAPLAAPEIVREEGEPVDPILENLRNKVVAYLREGFRTEGVVYSPDIIHQFVTAESKGELFEDFLRKHFPNPLKSREFTHKDVAEFMVYLAEPSLNDKIIDPCCGSGGLLLRILETLEDALLDAFWMEKERTVQYELRTGQFYFTELNDDDVEYYGLPLEDDIARWIPILRLCHQQQLTGVDSDPFAARTTDLHILIQGFPEIMVHADDALNSKQIGSGVYDMVICNPPSAEDNPTRFLRRSLMLAKPGGKMLLLLPDKMFDHEHRLVSSSLRHQLSAQVTIKAVINFPETADRRSYGQKRTLLYCIKKHLDVDQQSDIFVGDVTDFASLRDTLAVIENPDVPVCQSDEAIPSDLLFFILSSYQGSAYNLLIEALRRKALRGNLVSVEEWTHVKKSEAPQE